MLKSMLECAGRFDAEYANGLTSHLPMTLISLAKLGADLSVMERFYYSYSIRLNPKAEPRADIMPYSWWNYVGVGNHHAELAGFFMREISREGRASVIKKYVEPLAPGIASCGLHGLIRTAYGIEAEHDGEISEGLALWANRYHVLVPSGSDHSDGDPLQNLESMRRHQGRRSEDLAAMPIAEAMRAVSGTPWFAELSSSIRIHSDTLAELADIAARIFISSPDFAALHLITSVHAMRIVLPYVGAENIVRSFWSSFAAIYVQVGAPSFSNEPFPHRRLPSWSDIVEAAFKNLDDHTVKLVYSCWEEERAYGYTSHRFIAARQTGLL